jgi:hypothetical protein
LEIARAQNRVAGTSQGLKEKLFRERKRLRATSGCVADRLRRGCVTDTESEVAQGKFSHLGIIYQ